MIEVEGLNAGYGKAQVLYDVRFSASSKTITVIVGPNGSGKSTLLKTIMGLTTVYSGTVRFNGNDVSKLQPHERARIGMAYIPQLRSVFTELSVRENLIMAGYTLNKEEFHDRLDMAIGMFSMLERFFDRKVKTLSGGERQMLAMAMSLIRRPKLMMFDEPTGNLAPNIAAMILDKIVELRDKLGLTVILVEQSAKKALEIGEKAYLLVNGRVAFEGNAGDLLRNPEIGRIYLGIRPKPAR
ncbi:MAG: ABC transporter ATP-binding protein [Conexivisphaerales archaeon]